jgi:hypothetical protein
MCVLVTREKRREEGRKKNKAENLQVEKEFGNHEKIHL